MRKERVLLILGIWTIMLSYLGFPGSWKDILFTLTGLGLVALAYSMYYESQKKDSGLKENAEGEIEAEIVIEKTFENFIENNPAAR